MKLYAFKMFSQLRAFFLYLLIINVIRKLTDNIVPTVFQGGSSSGYSLTAFVLIALAEAENTIHVILYLFLLLYVNIFGKRKP